VVRRLSDRHDHQLAIRAHDRCADARHQPERLMRDRLFALCPDERTGACEQQDQQKAFASHPCLQTRNYSFHSNRPSNCGTMEEWKPPSTILNKPDGSAPRNTTATRSAA